MTYMTTPQHKNFCPVGHKIYNFGIHVLGHHNCFIYFVCSMPGSRGEDV